MSVPVQSPTMQLRLKLWFALLAVVACGAFATAEPISSLRPTDCVNDFAGVLSASTINQLKEMCRQILDKAQASVVVVTIKSTDGEDIVKYSVDLYQKWGIGQKGKDRGVLILLATQDRKYWTTVGYGLEPILPDGKVGAFGREAVQYLQRGDYDGAASLLASRVIDVIAKDAGVEITTSQPRRIEPYAPHRDTGFSPGGIIALIIVIIIVLAVPPLRRLLFYMILFGGFGGGNRGGGDFGGGGFGGGGGGFGGFGGGSTGGGGAGGSW
jgi:uncharacterized protein